MPIIQDYYPQWLKEILGDYSSPAHEDGWETPGDSQDLEKIHKAGAWEEMKKIHDTLMKGYEESDPKATEPWTPFHKQFRYFRTQYPNIYRTMEVWAWG